MCVKYIWRNRTKQTSGANSYITRGPQVMLVSSNIYSMICLFSSYSQSVNDLCLEYLIVIHVFHRNVCNVIMLSMLFACLLFCSTSVLIVCDFTQKNNCLDGCKLDSVKLIKRRKWYDRAVSIKCLIKILIWAQNSILHSESPLSWLILTDLLMSWY